MKLTEQEKQLLDKLASGALDGDILPDLQWHADGVICRRMIIRGTPYYISIEDNPCYDKICLLIEQYYKTDEMKLWFLKQNGHLMNDPDVIEYSCSNR